jgi:hypothetical protein
MAVPKVFISSTCYDLGQIRDSLSEFIQNYCYEATLSERGDVFYHPDLHTHESCINEIENCQLFILIIGGRFGGGYKFDSTKSITNAEYEAARIKKIPVFTFIKQDLYEDHRLYEKNKHNLALVEQIEFPSIDNQKYAINIFEFINAVRSSEVNNGFFSFEYVKDIKHYLGKQWAGMMFDFLNQRSKTDIQKAVNNTLDNLTLINKKTEELIEEIIRKLNPQAGQQQINNINKIALGSKFYTHVLRMYLLTKFADDSSTLSQISPEEDNWYDYIKKFSGFFISKKPNLYFEKNTNYKTIVLLTTKRCSWSVVTEDDIYPEEVTRAQTLFQYIKNLNQEERQKAIDFVTSSEEISD